MNSLKIVILGLSITSAWGNGHATTYRALVKQLSARGHDVLFLERDVPWYKNNRDMLKPPYGRTELYANTGELKERFSREIIDADFVMVGSYVPEGIEIGKWVTSIARGIRAFYDIDTPVTITKLIQGKASYISSELIPRYDLYLSFTGGPMLRFIERKFRARNAQPLYCSVDEELYAPRNEQSAWDLGYMGTYSIDRQPPLDKFLIRPARKWANGRFVVAGPEYPSSIEWPENVERYDHVPPTDHCSFYNRQRFTLNITRSDMIRAGYSPSVRLFEAAACGTPIISDYWEGLHTLFKSGREILICRSSADVLRYLVRVPDEERIALGARARARVLAHHTSRHRVAELERYIRDARRPEVAITVPFETAATGVLLEN